MSVSASGRELLTEPTATAYQPRGFGSFVRDVLRRPAALVSAAIILLLIFLAVLGPRIAPHGPNEIDVVHTLTSPTRDHLLGTDALGRDNLTRMIYGTRIALEIALPAVLGAFLIGALLGLLGGYLGGWLDKVLVVIFDTLISFPAVILGLALLSVLGPTVKTVAFVIGLSLMPYYGRLMRAQTLAERRNQYVKAERSLGASRFRVLRRHMLPNVLPPLLIIVAMDIPGAIAIEAGLAFLGVGVQPPTADWGVMLNDGFRDIGTSVWGVMGPIAALVLMTAAFTVLGETMRDVMDPAYRPPRRAFFGRLRRPVD